MNNSVEYKTTEHSGITSSKSLQKNQKYHLASINSGSKTSTAEAINSSHNYSTNNPVVQQNQHIPISQGAYQTMNAFTTNSVQKISNSSLDSTSLNQGQKNHA